MSGADDFMSAFASATEQDKEEAFEVSTLKLICQQLGATRDWVRFKSFELGPAFGCDWFNEEGFIEPHLVTGRCFTFNFVELFTKPSKSPVLDMYRTALDESHPPHEGGFCLVFKCFNLGRLVATSMSLPESQTHLHVSAGRTAFNVTPFAGFFRGRFGEPLEE